jgi:predicted lipoprotein
LLITLFSCNGTTTNPPTQNSFVELLTNQVDNIIIPTLLDYQENINELNNSIQTISLNSNDQDIIILKQAFEKAYTSYQAAAVHNYFAVENQSLISNTNLFPIDEISLENFIANNSYNFSTTAQERANGFPLWIT